MSKEIKLDRRHNAKGLNCRALINYLKESGIDLSKSFTIHVDEDNSLIIRQGFKDIDVVWVEPETTKDEPQEQTKRKPGRPKSK